MQDCPKMGLARIWLPLSEDNAQEWKRTGELDGYLQTYGLHVKKSLLDEFVRRGVISHRRRTGRGRGRGMEVWWPRAQCELLRTALELQRDAGARVVDLCPLPVASWVYWGDTAGVPLAQVQRAMQYWAEYQWRRAQRSFERVEQDARRLCRSVGHAGVSARELIAWLADRIYCWDAIQEAELVEQLRPVIDPDLRGVARGPREAPLSPAMVSQVLLARLRALDALRLNQVPVVIWEWARAFYLTGLAAYQQRREGWAREVEHDAQLAPYYQEQTLESFYAIVCQELLQSIGCGLMDLHALDWPPLWQPQRWIDGQIVGRVQTTLQWLPDPLGGPPIKHFQMRIQFGAPGIAAEWFD